MSEFGDFHEKSSVLDLIIFIVSMCIIVPPFLIVFWAFLKLFVL